MTFRNKILLSIWGVVVSLLIISWFVISAWTRVRIHDTFSNELGTSAAAIDVHERLQKSQLTRACAVIAESPRLRAVAELGDAGTAAQLLQDINQSTLSQVFILTDRDGRSLAQLTDGLPSKVDLRDSLTIDQALHFMASTDVWSIGGRVYRMVSVPIVVGSDLVGTLTLGFEITRNDIVTLKQATNSDLLLVSRGRAVLSTIDSSETRLLVPSLSLLKEHAWGDSGWVPGGTPISGSEPTESYLGTAFRLHDPAHGVSGDIYYIILKPLGREVRSAMASILGSFVLVAVVFLALTTIIGLIISRSITRPIQALVKGTDEIGRGNYDYAITLHGRDEISYLAERFMDMSAALREKITQLDALNRDLLGRNRDLDEMVQKLRSTQEELVRSERLAVAGKMTAQLAHEINNPIHNIQSLLKTTLGRIPESTRGWDLIGVAFEEVNRLSRLTLQMLNFYRTSFVEEKFVPTDLGMIIDDVATLVKADLEARKIALRIECEPWVPPIPVVPDKIKQVMLNLVTNAQDAMPSGGSIVIGLHRKNGCVALTIADTGTGITRENMAKIFDAFFTTKGKVSGVGLGLTVSHAIVSQHHGTMEVESEPGKGTTFQITLPLQEKA